MTDRERWIVYPLLFLSLGVSLRDSVTDSSTNKVIDAQLIRCQAVHVGESEVGRNRGFVPGTMTSFNSEGRPVAQLGRDLVCQRVVVNNPTGVPQVGIGSVTRRTAEGTRSSGVITVHGENGSEIIGLRARYQPTIKVTPLTSEDQPGKVALEVTEISEEGGQVQVYDSTRTTSIMLAHSPNQLGLYAVAGQNRAVPLAAVGKRASPSGARPVPDSPDEGAGASDAPASEGNDGAEE